jgi:hypothetical protein
LYIVNTTLYCGEDCIGLGRRIFATQQAAERWYEAAYAALKRDLATEERLGFGSRIVILTVPNRPVRV